jgi:hypothetical protein
MVNQYKDALQELRNQLRKGLISKMEFVDKSIDLAANYQQKARSLFVDMTVLNEHAKFCARELTSHLNIL